MTQRLFFILVLLGVFLVAPAEAAEWINISQRLPETDIESLTADPKDPKLLYAGSLRRVYKSPDSGVSWSQILELGASENRIQFIYVDPLDPKRIDVASSQGIWRSKDGGQRWEVFYKGTDDLSKDVFCVANDAKDPKNVWAGTGEGLILLDENGREIKRAGDIPHVAVYSIFLRPEDPGSLFITSQKGIYKSVDGGERWNQVSASAEDSESEETEDLVLLQEFGVEEIPTAPLLSNMIFMDNQNKFYAATKKGLTEAPKEGVSWTPVQGQSLPDKKINFLANSSSAFYAATDKGVFAGRPGSNSLRDISSGLDSKETKALFYSSAQDALFAATKRGIFKLFHPELTIAPETENQTLGAVNQETLRRFESEPTIQEIQNAAIQYAEVDPKKIQAWRTAAQRHALLPTLSFSPKVSRSRNVDIDRGGTADPDKFIIGPAEKSFDWSVGVNWNLGDLIWNNDQTSIDTRSRLMVQLRDDVLTEVTHLYFERRRLEVEMAATPNKDLPAQRIDQEIRLQELTAGIDALTGGYFSKKFSSAVKSN